MFLKVLFIGFLLFCVVLFSIKIYIVLKKLLLKKKTKGFTVGFFHPYCNAGGGGERVLWTAVRAVQKQYKDAYCIVYSGDLLPASDIIKNTDERFNIKLMRNVEIIYLKSRFLVEAKYYPILTLLMQSLGSIVLGLEALLKYDPDIYIDTMGYAWTFPIFKFLGSCPVLAYVHYPTISIDMMKNVENRITSLNNLRYVANSNILTLCKIVYYRLFACCYGLVGRQANIIMVNSSWTKNHILALWQKPQSTFTVYPPCDVSELNCIPLEIHDGKRKIISIAQFRPEKNHELQIRAFHKFLEKLSFPPNSPILVLIGSCRHQEDYQRVLTLRNLCYELKISENVDFKVNLTFQEIIQEMKISNMALHTMKDEHFGIGIVECMSAGLITIAHDSGGPKMDIVVDYNGKKTGFLAHDINTFADAMDCVWRMHQKELHEIRGNARDSISRFSAEKFEEGFLSAFKLLSI